MMRAVGYRANLPIEDEQSLIDLELPQPVPGPQDLLVRVAAVSVNPVDVKQRAKAPPPAGAARILGFDAAGTVEATGPEVTLFRPGDEVFYAGAIDRPGTNAEYHVVDARIVGRKPRNLSFAEAASMPLTAITAWELLFDRLGVPVGRRAGSERLLVIGGAGGVGSMLIQLARRLTGLTIIATASRPETRDWCLELGAHHVIDHSAGLVPELRRIGHPEVEMIAALTASDRHMPVFPEIVAPQGRIAMIDDPAVVDVVPLKRKSVSFHWELMFTRPLFGTPDIAAQHRLLDDVAGLVEAGLLRPTMTTCLEGISAAQLRKAHAMIESGRTRGKVVLQGW